MFVLLYQRCPEVAERETRSITVWGQADLPDDTYSFVELFCDEEGCDCRRVFVHVYAESALRRRQQSGLLATLSWGWEDEAFYRAWARYDLEPEDLHELKGPALVRLAPQSPYSDALLRHFQMMLQDPAFAERIIRHYYLFRRAGGEGPVSQSRRRKLGRNEDCWCGSGKKYKKCHLLADAKRQ